MLPTGSHGKVMDGWCRLLLIYKPGLVVSQTPKLQINKYSLAAAAVPNVDETAPLAKLLIYAWLRLSEHIRTKYTHHKYLHSLHPHTPTSHRLGPICTWVVIAGTWLLKKVQIHAVAVSSAIHHIQNVKVKSFWYFDLCSLFIEFYMAKSIFGGFY